MDFRGRVAVVTGGSSGLGLATARQLAAAGAHVWLIARDQARLDAALAQVQAAATRSTANIGCVSADLTDFEQARAAVERVTEAAGLPDLVINAAGFAVPGYFQDLDVETFHRQMDTNFFTALHMCKAVVPGMVARRSGYIVNVASEAAFLGVFGYTAYGAAKYALRGFSDVLRSELKRYRIRMSLVFPPNMDTPGFATENTVKPPETADLEESAKILTPDQGAEALLRGVRRNQYIIIPGFEGKLYYRLVGLAGDLQYPIMDMMVDRVLRKYGHA